MMPLADRIYLTIIHEDFVGDAVFPEVPGYFREVERTGVADVMPYSLVRYERIGKKAAITGP
jgi:dihydrofolate reductase